MNTKYLIKTLVVLAISLSTVNCTDMTETNYSDIPTDKFVPTNDDVLSIMGPAYSTMRDVLFGWIGYFDVIEESSDAIVTPARPNGWVDGGVYKIMHKHTWNSLQYHCEALWKRCYTGINNANRAIYQLQNNITVPGGSEKYVAELRTVRALYYYILIDNFGNVPIVDKFDLPLGFLPSTSPRDSVFLFIEKEIKESLPLLSKEVTKDTYGRFTYWGGEMLLAKLYLNAGVYTGTPRWQECSNLCTDIINSGKFALESNYRDMFATNNDNSTESVYAVPFDEIYGPWFHLHMKTLEPQNQKTYNLVAQPWGGNCAIPQFINTYDPDDERLNDTWIHGQQYASTGEALTCMYGKLGVQNAPLIYDNVVPSVDSTSERNGYRIGKYEIKMGALDHLSNDVPLLRYTDCYMMKAECLLRTGNADAAATLVSQIRVRDFKTNPAKAVVTGTKLLGGSVYDYGNVTDGVMLQHQGGGDIQYGGMLDELGWEFAAEFHRRSDMIRFGVYSRKMWLSKTNITDQFRDLFPIPDVILKTNTNLKQNPGY